MKRLPLVAGSLALLFAFNIRAQQRKPQPAKAPIGPAYSQVAFDLSVENLPPNFLGHSVKDFMAAQRAREDEAKKGEFEKSDAHAIRMKALNAKPILGSLTYDTVFAFSLTPKTQYDADKEALTITYDISQSGLPRPRAEGVAASTAKALVTVDTEIMQNENYTAQNAFGATVTATRLHTQSIALHILNYPQFKGFMPGYKGRFTYRILMPAEEAMTAKKELRVLFICKLASPLRWLDTDSKAATFDMPIDYLDIKSIQDIQLLELWFYDFDNGRVRAKYRPDNPTQ
jgi:hypothetical protein